MLHLIDDALEAFVRHELDAGSRFDVSFALPDKEWAAGLSRPTLDLYLAKVDPNPPEATAGVEFFEQDGLPRRRMALPRVAFTYYATAWVSEVRDEHRLLGSLLAAVARVRSLDEEYLPEALQTTRPAPTVRLDNTVPQPGDLWPAIGGRCHPALALLVTAAVDTGQSERAAPLPDGVELGVVDRDRPARRSERTTLRR
ncbi:MAG TPA: Pvc16 family protein [Acidimicrobiia bacterium]|nr:Pvc16 family protein [Acidimicrobiia bacterium]